MKKEKKEKQKKKKNKEKKGGGKEGKEEKRRDETKRLLSMSETRSQHITAKHKPRTKCSTGPAHLTLCQLSLPDSTRHTNFPSHDDAHLSVTTTSKQSSCVPWRAKSPPEPEFPASKGPRCGHGRFCRTTTTTLGPSFKSSSIRAWVSATLTHRARLSESFQNESFKSPIKLLFDLPLFRADLLEVRVQQREGFQILHRLLVQVEHLVIRPRVHLVRHAQATLLPIQFVPDAPQVVRGDGEVLALRFGFLAHSTFSSFSSLMLDAASAAKELTARSSHSLPPLLPSSASPSSSPGTRTDTCANSPSGVLQAFQ